jgi:hypothetical protein
MAPAKVLQGAVRLQGLTSSPTPETHVRVACACAADETARMKAKRAKAFRVKRMCDITESPLFLWEDEWVLRAASAERGRLAGSEKRWAVEVGRRTPTKWGKPARAATRTDTGSVLGRLGR